MKLVTAGPFEPKRPVTPHEAVAYVADKQASNYDTKAEQTHERAEALIGMLGRLIEVLIGDGVLNPEQVSRIFDDDVVAQDWEDWG